MSETRWGTPVSKNGTSLVELVGVTNKLGNNRSSSDDHGKYTMVSGDIDDDGTDGEGETDTTRSSSIVCTTAMDSGDSTIEGSDHIDLDDNSGSVTDSQLSSSDALTRLMENCDDSGLTIEQLKKERRNNPIDISQDDEPEKNISSGNVLKERPVILSTATYGIMCFGYIILDETLPLFMKQDIPSGGFGFSSFQIGLVLSTTGGVMLIFTLTLLPKARQLSKLWLLKTSNWCAIPVMLIWPFLNLLLREEASLSQSYGNGLFWVALLLLSTIKNILATSTFTAVRINITLCNVVFLFC